MCHISHCEIKSHRIWPIWKAIPMKNSNLCGFVSFLHEKKKKKKKKERKTRLYWESSIIVMFKKISQNFVKSPLKVCLISKILVHSLWHVCQSQLKQTTIFIFFLFFFIFCFNFSEKSILYSSCESSDMKCQDLFSLTKKKIIFCLVQILLPLQG